MPRCVVVEPGAAGRLCRGLSRVMGNYHARFLGGDGAVMRCLYPAPLGLTVSHAESGHLFVSRGWALSTYSVEKLENAPIAISCQA